MVSEDIVHARSESKHGTTEGRGRGKLLIVWQPERGETRAEPGQVCTLPGHTPGTTSSDQTLPPHSTLRYKLISGLIQW